MTETVQGNTRSPTMEEVLRTAIEYYLQDTHVAMPGRVEEYNAATQKVDVKPLIKRRLATDKGEELLEELPVITDVPVMFPRTGRSFLTFPIEVGDHVMLIFNERSIDKFMAGQGEDTDPDDFRMHDLSDAVAYPGLFPDVKAIKDIDGVNLVIGLDEGGIQAHFTPDGTMEVKVDGTADEAVALGNALQIFWDTVFKPVFDAHIHPTGVGPSGPPTPLAPAFDAAIISTILKLKSG